LSPNKYSKTGFAELTQWYLSLHPNDFSYWDPLKKSITGNKYNEENPQEFSSCQEKGYSILRFLLPFKYTGIFIAYLYN